MAKHRASFIQSVFNANPSRQGTDVEQKLTHRERKIAGWYSLLRGVNRQIDRLYAHRDKIQKMIDEEERKLQ